MPFAMTKSTKCIIQMKTDDNVLLLSKRFKSYSVKVYYSLPNL